MFILGSKGKTKIVGSGSFFCPNCRTRRRYDRKRLAKYFTLYFIPLIEMEDLGEFVECRQCSKQFETDVLKIEGKPPKSLPAQDQTQVTEPDIKKWLAAGIPPQVILESVASRGVDKDTATKLLVDATGGSLRRCDPCQILYSPDLAYCSNCGASLSELSGSE